MDIKPRALTMEELLQGSFFIIPRFQREYSWEREDVAEFWRDLQSNNLSSYFIGSMTFFPAKQHGVLNVVDGQQRLTTVTLFLCAIRDSLTHFGFNDLAKAIQNFVSRQDRDGEERYVLQTETSYPFLQEHIQKVGQPDVAADIGAEEERLKDAFDSIRSYIDGIIPTPVKPASPSKRELKAIQKCLVDLRDQLLGLILVSLQIDEEDDAYVVFETLNTRGKDLDVSDLVKNHLLRHLRNSTAVGDIPRERWNKISRQFSKSASGLYLSEFLLHYWLSKYEYVAERKLFGRIKQRISNKSTASDFLATLEREHEYYLRIFEPDVYDWTRERRSIVASLKALSVFRVRQPMPMVLAVLRTLFEKRITLAQAKRALSAIECFHFSFTAVTSQRSSGGISHMYSSSARELDAADTPGARESAIRALIAKLQGRIPSFEEFQANFEQIMYVRAETREKPLVDYVLRCFQAHLSGADQFDPTSQTIEHIYPENPKAGPRLPTERVGQLGNLVWVSGDLNRELDNLDFVAKRGKLKAKGVALDPVLEDAESWDADTIQRRTEWMAKTAYETVWKV